MTQDELGRDRLLRAALRRAEPTDAVPEEQDVAMGPERQGTAPEQPSGSGLMRATREDKRVLGPSEADRSKSGKARLNPGQGEKRPGEGRSVTAGPLALPAPQGQASSSGQGDPMLVESIPDHPAEEFCGWEEPGQAQAQAGGGRTAEGVAGGRGCG